MSDFEDFTLPPSPELVERCLHNTLDMFGLGWTTYGLMERLRDAGVLDDE